MLLARTSFAHCLMLPERNVRRLDWRSAEVSRERVDRLILLMMERSSAGDSASWETGLRQARTQEASGMAGMGSGSASKPIPTSWEMSGRKIDGSMPCSRAQSARQFKARRDGRGEREEVSRLSEGERSLAFSQEV